MLILTMKTNNGDKRDSRTKEIVLLYYLDFRQVGFVIMQLNLFKNYINIEALDCQSSAFTSNEFLSACLYLEREMEHSNRDFMPFVYLSTPMGSLWPLCIPVSTAVPGPVISPEIIIALS